VSGLASSWTLQTLVFMPFQHIHSRRWILWKQHWFFTYLLTGLKKWTNIQAHVQLIALVYVGIASNWSNNPNAILKALTQPSICLLTWWAVWTSS